MIMDSESDDGRQLVRRTLPWAVAAVALAVYVFTLNRWVSLLNLPQVSSLAGWTWQPDLFHPVYFLVTFPLRWLPDKAIPLALNLFSAVCAALVVAQLARSVVLLPHDRTHEQRERETGDFYQLSGPLAWLPPLFAALVFGLQLTFWEHGTNGTPEMVDLLLFSYVIRCLLEYRLDGQESRLYRAALAYGAAITGNYAMIAFAPAFLAALIWIRSLSFFNVRFLLRTALCGVAGLTLYLLPPLVVALSGMQDISFWQALSVNLQMQKKSLLDIPFNRGLVFSGDWPLWIFALPSLVPLFMISIRWPAHFGDPSKIGVLLTTWIIHLFHLVFLLAALWVAFDPPRFSGRGLGLPLLTFSYLAALCIGYFSGYFLLVFRPATKTSRRRSPTFFKPLHQASIALVLLLFVFVPAGLLYRNLPQIQLTNGPMVRQFTDGMAEGLSPSGLILSDDVRRLILIQAWLAGNGRAQDFLAIHTQSLQWPAYQRYLHRRHGDRWPLPAEHMGAATIPDGVLIQQVLKFAETNALTYLHPSFGYYFEFFHDQPYGLAHRLTRFDKNILLPPSLTPEVLAFNEGFWSRMAERAFPTILAATVPPDPNAQLSLVERLFKRLRLKPHQNQSAVLLGTFYSRSLDHWAVELQKANEFEKATERFELAQQLNPENVVAQINLQFNRDHRAGRMGVVEWTKSIEERMGKYRTWEEVLTENGPYDEPSLCYAQGYVFMRGNLFRQAAQSFDRVRALSPEDLTSRLLLAQLHLSAHLPDQTLAITQELLADPGRFHLTGTNFADLISLTATAYYLKHQPEQAERVIEAELARQPTNELLQMAATRVYTESGHHSNALAVLERQLRQEPDDLIALFNKGVVQIRANAHADAIQTLTRVLSLQPTNTAALLNRAIAHLQSEQLDAAQKDYETLSQFYTNSFRVLYGLGEIAFRRKDTNAAIRHYENYLLHAPTNMAESQFIRARLKALQGEER